MADLHQLAFTDLARFRDESRRLGSFVNWPSGAGAQPAALSRAGFYYTGERQKAACAFCQVTIEDWTFADQAIAKHRDRSPNCPFVLQAYGNSVVVDGPRTPSSSSSSSSSAGYLSIRSPYLWESERRKTFAGWPCPFIAAEDLARAGFVYLKRDDRVQCVYCNGIVGAWEEGDVPWMEHQRHFRNCPFIMQHPGITNVSIEDEYRSGHQPGVTMPPVSRSTQMPILSVPRGFDVVANRVPVPGFRPERNGVTTSTSSSSSAAATIGRTKTSLINGELNILQHSQAKNPIYKTKESRLRTFANWPTCVHQDPELLAEAGFFYTGMSDHVKCFHCNGGLRNWEPKDVPWEEHARWFPDCEYISLNKGKEFIEIANHNRPTNCHPSGAGSGSVAVATAFGNGTNSGSQGDPDLSEAELDVLMTSDVALEALELNLDEHQIREAMRRRMSHAGYPFADVESLANAVLNLEKVPAVRGLETECGRGGGGGGGGISRSVSLTELPVTRDKNSTSSITTSKSGSLTKKSAANTDVDPKQCKICWDKEVCVVFLPCGHLISCAECSSALKDCPFCRQEIKGTVRTYWT